MCRILSVSGSHNGSPLSVRAIHADEKGMLPARYLEKYRVKKEPKPSFRPDVLSDEQVYAIRAYGDAGNSHSATARNFNIPISSARRIVKRLAFGYLPERHNHTLNNMTKARQYRKEGLSNQEIADKLGLSISYTNRLLANAESRLCK